MNSEHPTNRLPRIEDCLELYRRAYERHGSTRFTAEQVDCERQQILEMAVAYGLLSWDGVSYCVTAAPTDPLQSWRELFRRRADRVSEEVSDDDSNTDHQLGADTAETVYVSESDDAESVRGAFDDSALCEGDELLLRSAGENAHTAQRIADQLCGGSRPDGEATQFQKEFTDVVGESKDELEFRVCLRLVSRASQSP